MTLFGVTVSVVPQDSQRTSTEPIEESAVVLLPLTALNVYTHYDLPDGMVKVPAAWMIEQCGWKGKSLGRAGVHSKQALVLVNRGGATGGEVLELCRVVCRDVYERFGIEIKPEVNIV